MPHFTESLENRQFLSTVTLAAAEAALMSDATTLYSDALHARSDLLAAAKTFQTDFNSLHLKASPLKTALQRAVNSARTLIQSDVNRIVTAGYRDGQAVFKDVLHITVDDTGNATRTARDQKHLAADTARLRNLETPLVVKLENDVDTSAAKISSAVNALALANSSAAPLQTDWMTLSDIYVSSKQTLTSDLTNVINDLDALSTAT